LVEVIFLHDFYGCIVKLLPDDTFVKSGKRIHLDERDALDLATKLHLPAPKVHEAYRTPEGDVSIRMDFIEGDSLEGLWPTMPEVDRIAICRQLREILTVMQSVESKTGIIGSCGGGVVRDCRRMNEITGGPFDDEAGFNMFVTDLVKSTPKAIKEALQSQLRTDHRIVFAHGDLSQHNILIKDKRIVGLIDWEHAGWYPEYWDYVKFFEHVPKNGDWREYAHEIFPKIYYDELATFQGILRWGIP
jgi:serine/threonine protein kinase